MKVETLSQHNYCWNG